MSLHIESSQAITVPLSNPSPINERELEQVVGVKLLEDYNLQLTQIAGRMQDNLEQKQIIRTEIGVLNDLSSRSEGGKDIELSPEEARELGEQFPKLVFSSSGGKTVVTRSSVANLIADKQQDLAGFNTAGEMTALEIQSIVDQRKLAITLVSNLMAGRNETLLNIARNLKG